MRCFSIGDTVFHPGLGFGTVESINRQSFICPLVVVRFSSGLAAKWQSELDLSDAEERVLCERAAAHFASLRGEQ